MKKIIILILILNLTFLTACWDMIELNERAFPYTIGVDVNHEGDENFQVTFSHPNINAIGDQAVEEDLIHVINAKGDSFFDASQNLTSELYQPLYFKHLKVLVLSKELVQNKQFVLEIIDGIQRDFITNNNVTLLLTDSAHDLIQFTRESKIQQVIEGTIYSILINRQESNFFTPIKASKFVQNMDETGTAIIPIGYHEENISIAGGSVFKDYQYMGDISPEENRIINLLNNEINQDQIDIDHGGYNLSLMVTDTKTRKKLVDKEKLKIELDIELEGHIHSHILDKGHQITNEKILGEMEEIAEKQIDKEVNDVISKIQKDLNSDVIFISDYLRKFHPKLWEEIEEDYDSIFPHINLETKMTLNIRRRGLIM